MNKTITCQKALENVRAEIAARLQLKPCPPPSPIYISKGNVDDWWWFVESSGLKLGNTRYHAIHKTTGSYLTIEADE